MPKEWNAEALLELGRAFQPASVLLAAAELELFDPLGNAEQDATAVARHISADLRATTMLLDALAALAIIEKHGDKYRLPASVAGLLTTRGTQSVLPMLQHQANCMRRWSQLANVTKTGRPVQRQSSVRGEANDQAAFIGAMDVVSGPIASQLVSELHLPPFRHVLDIGGASGTWTVALLQAYPSAKATIFDLPHVIPMAEERLAAAGLRDRVDLAPGNFTTDPLPAGADLAWLSAIAHQNSRAENVCLFTSIARALTEDGRLLIRDVVMDASKIHPVAGAVFAINMLVATDGGATFTFDEFHEDLTAAGFANAKLLRHDPAMNSIIEARKTG